MYGHSCYRRRRVAYSDSEFGILVRCFRDLGRQARYSYVGRRGPGFRISFATRQGELLRSFLLVLHKVTFRAPALVQLLRPQGYSFATDTRPIGKSFNDSGRLPWYRNATRLKARAKIC